MSTHEDDVFRASCPGPRLDETLRLELGEPTSEALRAGAPEPEPLDAAARQTHVGGALVFVPLTPRQLALAIEAVGSHAGRLVDEARDPDAYVPFADLQTHLWRYSREA